MTKLTPDEARVFDETFAEYLRSIDETIDPRPIKDPAIIDLILALARRKDYPPEKQAILLSACRKLLPGITTS